MFLAFHNGGYISALIKSAPKNLNAVFSDIARFPHRMEKSEFYLTAYPAMYVSRQLDNRFKELFRKGLVKGTVIIAAGNEASSVGMAMPFTPGKDVAALLHRNLGSHLILGCAPFDAVCQYMANERSPTLGKEGNVHFGDADALRFPMVSHLGSMLAVAVGSTWSARRNGRGAFGLTVIGDGGSSTGQFHEALNLASVNKVPVVFIVENNGYAFSTPVENQYNCKWSRRLRSLQRGYRRA
jgi:2-oxoisovalerate dehydrogenase E1 component